MSRRKNGARRRAVFAQTASKPTVPSAAVRQASVRDTASGPGPTAANATDRCRLVFEVKLTLRSPFLFRDPGGALFGIDAAPLRDSEGRALIPGDQLRGILREALSDIADAAPSVLSPNEFADLFGRGAYDARESGEALADDPFTAYAPVRANIICDDLRADKTFTPGQAVRVEIEPETGAARPGFLQIAELVAPPAAEVKFEGKLVVFAQPGKETKLTKALQKALEITTSIGAQKSIGFGTVVAGGASAITLASNRNLSINLRNSDIKPEPVTYHMTFDRPFLVDAVRAADNLFVGSEIVPGAVVKGALARRLQLGGVDLKSEQIASLLAGTVFTHAFPENTDGHPIGQPLPLSLVALKGDNGLLFTDTLGQEGKGTLLDSRPALYASDWKDDWADKARAFLGLPILSRDDYIGQEIRVHTAIDTETGIAATGKLFATAARSHLIAAKGAGARKWRLSVVPPERADKTLWAAMLALLEEGLDSVGRTGASVSFRRTEHVTCLDSIATRNGRVAIMLTTPAILFDAEPWDNEAKSYEGRWSSARAAYTAYWKMFLPDATLVDHVAQQRLAGGYAARRHRPYKSGYVPFVLTEPGAVFLLENVDHAEIDKFMRSNLPLPPLNGENANWHSCPYVPENGFGAVTANHLNLISKLGVAQHG